MAATNNERAKILQMLEDGKISAEEASTLLRAMGTEKRSASGAPGFRSEGRYLHVQVTDIDTGKSKVNVTVPMKLVGIGLRMAERFAPEFEDFDMQELEEALSSGEIGKMVEVIDEEDNEKVEVYVE